MSANREGPRLRLAPAATWRMAAMAGIPTGCLGGENRRVASFALAPDTGDDLVVRQGAAEWMGHERPGDAEARRDPGFGVSSTSSIGCRRSQTGGYSMGVVGVVDSVRQGRTPTGLQDALERLCRSGP